MAINSSLINSSLLLVQQQQTETRRLMDRWRMGCIEMRMAASLKRLSRVFENLSHDRLTGTHVGLGRSGLTQLLTSSEYIGMTRSSIDGAHEVATVQQCVFGPGVQRHHHGGMEDQRRISTVEKLLDVVRPLVAFAAVFEREEEGGGVVVPRRQCTRHLPLLMAAYSRRPHELPHGGAVEGMRSAVDPHGTGFFERSRWFEVVYATTCKEELSASGPEAAEEDALGGGVEDGGGGKSIMAEAMKEYHSLMRVVNAFYEERCSRTLVDYTRKGSPLPTSSSLYSSHFVDAIRVVGVEWNWWNAGAASGGDREGIELLRRAIWWDDAGTQLMIMQARRAAKQQQQEDGGGGNSGGDGGGSSSPRLSSKNTTTARVSVDRMRFIWAMGLICVYLALARAKRRRRDASRAAAPEETGETLMGADLSDLLSLHYRTLSKGEVRTGLTTTSGIPWQGRPTRAEKRVPAPVVIPPPKTLANVGDHVHKCQQQRQRQFSSSGSESKFSTASPLYLVDWALAGLKAPSILSSPPEPPKKKKPKKEILPPSSPSSPSSPPSSPGGTPAASVCDSTADLDRKADGAGAVCEQALDFVVRCIEVQANLQAPEPRLEVATLAHTLASEAVDSALLHITGGDACEPRGAATSSLLARTLVSEAVASAMFNMTGVRGAEREDAAMARDRTLLDGKHACAEQLDEINLHIHELQEGIKHISTLNAEHRAEKCHFVAAEAVRNWSIEVVAKLAEAAEGGRGEAASAAAKIQALQRGKLYRAELEQKQQAAAKVSIERGLLQAQHSAATNIQAVHRGRKQRSASTVGQQD